MSPSNDVREVSILFICQYLFRTLLYIHSIITVLNHHDQVDWSRLLHQLSPQLLCQSERVMLEMSTASTAAVTWMQQQHNSNPSLMLRGDITAICCRLERKRQRWGHSWAWYWFLFALLPQRQVIWTFKLIANDNIEWRWAEGGMQGRVDWWHSVSCVLTNNSCWVRAGGRHTGEGNLHIQHGEFFNSESKIIHKILFLGGHTLTITLYPTSVTKQMFKWS